MVGGGGGRQEHQLYSNTTLTRCLDRNPTTNSSVRKFWAPDRRSLQEVGYMAGDGFVEARAESFIERYSPPPPLKPIRPVRVCVSLIFDEISRPTEYVLQVL